jgi:hypothetical protein
MTINEQFRNYHARRETNMTTKQLPGGMLWNRKTTGVPGWQAEGGQFDILEGNGYVVLVAFEHDPKADDDCDFWRQRFPTVEAAMEHAEKM